MIEMSEELKYIKTQSEKLKVDCEFIKYQFENTSTTISNSLTNLSELVNKKVLLTFNFCLDFIVPKPLLRKSIRVINLSNRIVHMSVHYRGTNGLKFVSR